MDEIILSRRICRYFLLSFAFRTTYRKFCRSLLSWTTFSLNVNLFTTLVTSFRQPAHYNWNFSVRFTSLSLSAVKRNKWKAVFSKEILKTRAHVLLLCSNNYANYCSRFHDRWNLKKYIYIYVYISKEIAFAKSST